MQQLLSEHARSFTATATTAGSEKILMGADSVITATYRDQYDTTGAEKNVSITCVTKTNSGNIAWDSATYKGTWSIATVTVTNPDLNTTATTIQTVARDTTLTGTVDLDAGKVAIKSSADTCSRADLKTSTSSLQTSVADLSTSINTLSGQIAAAQANVGLVYGALIERAHLRCGNNKTYNSLKVTTVPSPKKLFSLKGYIKLDES